MSARKRKQAPYNPMIKKMLKQGGIQPTQDEIKRFLSHIEKTGSCWNWTRTCNKCGYGGFSFRCTQIGAHVFSYVIHKGKIDLGLCVCHKCDNPKCVNPDHLWLGTHAENMKDMGMKHRGISNGLKGEKVHLSKLKESDVLEIRASAAKGIKQYELAQKYGFSKAGICMIVKRKTWKHI